MQVIEEKGAMREWSRSHKRGGKSVALVPTMGYLHAGHLSLVARAKSLADVVVVSIYVNPSQFGPNEDLDKYPRDIPGDLQKLQDLDVAAAFCPKDLYDSTGGPHRTWVTVETLDQPLCGAGRPGHFRGVATVVAKLFNIVEPDVAVFGKKDFQQFRIICQMVRDLDMSVRVEGAPLMREIDGLAMSSRNVRLTSAEREQALSISKALFEAKEKVKKETKENRGRNEDERRPNIARELVQEVQEKITAAGGRVEYVEIVDRETLDQKTDALIGSIIAVAAFFGSVRLIDNMDLNDEV